MRLTAFSVEKYRSIIKRSHFSVFDKTVIVGPNNEGKSNIMRALVCSLNILSVFAASPNMLRKEGKTIIYMPPLLGNSNIYSWQRDFPIPYQKTNGNIENKKSIFILDFELNEVEFNDFKKLTQTKLKHPLVPIRLEVNDQNVRFTLNIPGHFYKKASESKMIKIAKFITDKINICYIDAERTASTATDSIGSLLDLQIRKIQEQDEYKKLLEQIKQLYSPVLDNMSEKVNELLKGFIPSIKNTKITLRDNYYDQRFFRRIPFSVSINDGVDTLLARKGSGVQSMVALFLAQYVSTTLHQSENFILAIDEPESHLHPQGIHDIKNILDDIAINNQVIIATHSPLLAQTSNPHKNIIVKDNYATPASKIAEVRDILGVHPADNLLSSEMVILVEGAADENMFPHILSTLSSTLKTAIDERRLLVLSCGGTSHMENYVNFLRNQLCNIYIFVDDDAAGNQLIEKMKNNGSIQDSEYTILRMNGLRNSEIENIFKPDIYASIIAQKYAIPVDRIISCCSTDKKWSTGMENLFREFGKSWNEDTAKELKTLVSEAVKSCTELQLIEHRKHALVAGCSFLEQYFKG